MPTLTPDPGDGATLVIRGCLLGSCHVKNLLPASRRHFEFGKGNRGEEEKLL